MPALPGCTLRACLVAGLLAGAAVPLASADGDAVFQSIDRCLDQQSALILDRLPAATVAAAHRDAVGRTPLTYLIERTDEAADARSSATACAIAERLIADGCDADGADIQGNRPLHLAAGTGQATLVDLLLVHGAAVDVPDAHGHTALLDAVLARWPNPAVVASLLAHHAHVDGATTDPSPATPLSVAIACRITALDDVRQGVAAVFDGPDPAHRAADALSIITALLDAHARADIQVMGPTGFAWPALHAAIRGADLTTAHALIDHGAPTAGTVDAGQGVMRLAIDSGHADAVRFLAQRGIGRTETDARGNPVAFSATDAEVLDALLVSGLSPDVRRTDRFTLLHAAAEADQGDAIRVLLAHGAAIDLTVEPPVVRRAAREPVSERWIIGRTPLWIALAGHHAHALTALLAQGATATVRLSDGTTTLHLAARWTGPLTPDDAADAPGSRPRDVSGLIRLLVAEGADPNALTLTSAEPGAPVHRTPLHEACAVHAFEAAETLLSLGADGHCADSLGCEPWRLALTDAARRGSWVDLFARHGIAIATTDLHRLALQDAVEQGDHEQVERLVADEPSLAALAPPAGSRADQAPLLQVAIGRHDPALVAILLEHGADALARDGRGRPSLHRAIETNQPELLTLLLAHGAQLDDLSRCDAASAVTPLAIALGRNPGGQPLRDPVQPLALVRALLDAGADANAPIGPDHSALEIACASGQIAAAKLLIAHGAHCAFCDSAGRTLLHLLAWGSPAGMELAELLLAAGLDVNQAETVRRETPLHRLARSARTPAIRLLVAHGAHVDARDVRQRTPLAFAAESGNVSGLEALLEAGAAVDAVDADGQTPLTIAIEAAQVESVAHLLAHHAASAQTELPAVRGWSHLKQSQHYKLQALLEQDATVASARLIHGQTLLMRAADRSDALSVRLLLEHGAHPDAADDQGRTAVMHAVLGTGLDRLALISCLLSAGADAAHTDTSGRTASTLVPSAATGDPHQDHVNAEIAALLRAHAPQANTPHTP